MQERERSLHHTAEAMSLDSSPFPEPLVKTRGFTGENPVPAGAWLRAVVAWLGCTYLLCYVAGPIVLHLTTGGGENHILLSLLYLPGFVATTLVTAVGAAIFQPTMHGPMPRRLEPIGSAVLGSFVGWAIIQNSSDVLMSFFAMPTGLLLGALLLNFLEACLVGALLGSLTRSRLVAFGLGVGFQYLVMTFVLTIVAAILS